MPAQSILITKVVGTSAEEIIRRFGRWSASRNTGESNDFNPSQWPVHVREEMDEFVGRLKANRFDLTIAYFDEYVDLWSSPATRWFADLSELVEVSSDQHELACYPLPDQDKLQNVLNRLLRQKSANPEDRWFAGHALEALHAGIKSETTSAFIVIRTVTGPLADDEEITQAGSSLSEWLR